MFLWQLLQSLYLVKPSWLRYCCAVQKEVTGTSPAGSPTPAPRTDPAPFLSPRGPSARPARGCWPRGGCKSPGERAAPCSQPVPSPPPAGGHKGTQRDRAAVPQRYPASRRSAGEERGCSRCALAAAAAARPV